MLVGDFGVHELQTAIGDLRHVIPSVAADGGGCRRRPEQNQNVFRGIPWLHLLGRSCIKLIAMNDLTVVAKAAAKKKRCGRNHGQFLWARQKVASAPQFPKPHCTRLSCKANADAWAWPRIASLGAIDGAL